MPHISHDFLDEARRAIPEVSVEAVAARRTHGDEVVLLDVREHEEVRAGYIEGAVTIPRGFLEFRAAEQLPQTDTDIVVYCASGARSLLAAQVLRAMGYTRACTRVSQKHHCATIYIVPRTSGIFTKTKGMI